MQYNYICKNGSFFTSHTAIITTRNRSFLYGDALFETIHCLGTSPQFIELHWKRLSWGMEVLKMEPGDLSAVLITNYIEKLLNKNRIFKGARIRLTVYREDGGLYTPENNHVSWVMEATSLENEKYTLNTKGLLVDIYDEVHKPVYSISNLKTTNALIFVLAGIYREKNHLDECIVLNQYGRIAESISSNIFIVKDDVAFTPPLTEGCIAGTMRDAILHFAESGGFAIEEKPLFETDLYHADEVFLTNAIHGIRWVGAYKDRRYFNFFSKRMITVLNEKAFSQGD